MKKFEYKMATINAKGLKKEDYQSQIQRNFNKWGNQGWELVKMEPITSGGAFLQGATTRGFFIVFKREMKEQ